MPSAWVPPEKYPTDRFHYKPFEIFLFASETFDQRNEPFVKIASAAALDLLSGARNGNMKTLFVEWF